MKFFTIAFLLVSVVVALLLPSTRAHGFLDNPPGRNVIANSDYCPHCLNMGTVCCRTGCSCLCLVCLTRTSDVCVRQVKQVSNNGKLSWPEGMRGICGDPFNGPRKHEEGGEYYGDGTPSVTYARGGIAEIDIFLSTNHRGRFRFRICKVQNNGPGSEKAQLTEECLDQHVLRQANIPQAQRPVRMNRMVHTCLDIRLVVSTLTCARSRSRSLDSHSLLASLTLSRSRSHAHSLALTSRLVPP